jgi:hypothetical protein
MLRIQSMKFEVNIQYTAVVVTCDRLVHRFSLSKLSFGIYKTPTDKFYSWAISPFTCVFLLARQFSVNANRRRNTRLREQRHKGNISLSSIGWDRHCIGWFECLYEVT